MKKKIEFKLEEELFNSYKDETFPPFKNDLKASFLL